MKFIIRDLFLVTAIVALALGWWMDRSHLNSTVAQLSERLFRAEFRLVPLETFTQGADRIEEIKLAAEKSPPPPEAAVEILHYVRDEKDYRLRIRAMDVFPRLAERTEAIDVLREALRDQDVERSAEGVVPCYAAANLARMNAPEAVEEIQTWRETLTSNSPYDRERTRLLINKADQFLRTSVPNTLAPAPNPPQP